jgi:hypothetical protein
MGLSELTGLPRRKCKDVLQCKEVLKHRGTENTEEGGGSSDRLGERQASRFENLKVFEFAPMLLGGSAPKPPGFFEAWRRKINLLLAYQRSTTISTAG